LQLFPNYEYHIYTGSNQKALPFVFLEENNTISRAESALYGWTKKLKSI